MKQQMLWLGACLFTVIAGQSPSYAQDIPVPAAQNAGTRRFDPSFFVQYAPVSALDMVERIPGFSIAEGDDRRGFGENAGNVLIDGDRPSTKSDTIFTVLARIPASQVERIELIEQAGADGETSGQSQIVNVIRRAGNAQSGTYEGHLANGFRGGFAAYASGSLTLKRGNTTYELNAGSFDNRIQGRGPERFSDALGSQRIQRETRFYEAYSGYTEYRLGGTIKTQLAGAKLNLNGKASWSKGFDRRFGTYTLGSGAFGGTERLFNDEPNNDFGWELGGDTEFVLAPKLTTKLIGLYQTERDREDAFFETRRPSLLVSLSETASRSRSSETVFRVQNDWSGIAQHVIQFGAELAYNRLDSRFSNTSRSGGAVTGTSTANILVRETRIEPFVADVWTLSPAWKLESGTIFEFSTLRLSGDSSARRSFRFAKPRITATWTINKATTLELKANHQVAQLDFNDFATSVDFGQGNLFQQGSRDLLPEKVTTLSALVRRKFFDRGSIQLEGSYQLVRDTQDRVPIQIGSNPPFDGAGNIGNSRRWNAELEITLPFDWLTKPAGIFGMELKYVGHYHGSEVTDPVTGLKRAMSFRPEWHQNWAFRHDIAKAGLAWGVTIAAAAPNKAYFVNLFRWEYTLPDAEIFLEYRKWKYGTLRLRLIDIPQDRFERTRFVYVGGRANGFISQIIERDRRIDPRVQLSLIGKF